MVNPLYRETITERVRQVYTHKKQTAEAGEYAEIVIVFAPLERGEGAGFVSDLGIGVLPAEFVEAVRAGVMAQAESGIFHGFPVTDFLATLVDGKYHDIDSSPAVFEFAGRQCFREGVLRAAPILLEPLMSVSALIPQKYTNYVRRAACLRGGGVFGQFSGGPEDILAIWLGLSTVEKFRNDVEYLTDGEGALSVAVGLGGYKVMSDEDDDPDPAFPGAIGARAVA